MKNFALLCIILLAQVGFAQVDFDGQIQPIFSNNCAFSGCHAGASPQQGMNLSAGQAFNNIVNVPSSERPELLRVDPGDPDMSYLFMKITGAPGIVGSRMPLGRPPLSNADIALIEQWISELSVIGIDNENDGRITRFELEQNFPNPFNPSTTIRYQLPISSNVKLVVYNLIGQEVRTLVDVATQPAGGYEVEWDGQDNLGNAVGSGVYFYKLITRAQALTRKMILMK